MEDNSLLVINLQKENTTEEWFDFRDGVRFKLRSIGYTPYQAAIEYLAEIRRDVKENIALADKTRLDMLAEAAAAHLIVDWSGVWFSEEKEEPFTVEAAKLLLRSSDIGAEAWTFIFTKSSELQEAADAKKEQFLGKSERPTRGRSTARTKAQSTK